MLKKLYHKFINKNLLSTKKPAYCPPLHSICSFSQSGEDAIVNYLFKLRGIEKPSYIDIGAHSPTYLSNTAIFYLKGSRGVNIEPNPDLIEKFYTQRPGDINLNIGISSNCSKNAEFYCFEDNALSTFSKEEADALEEMGKKISKKLQLKTETIQKIIDKYCNGIFPDFLSIDIEGMEYAIIKSIGSMNSQPKVICVETALYSPIGAGAKRSDLMKLIESFGYIIYADTNLNSIYVKSNFWLPCQPGIF